MVVLILQQTVSIGFVVYEGPVFYMIAVLCVFAILDPHTLPNNLHCRIDLPETTLFKMFEVTNGISFSAMTHVVS